MNKKVLSAVVVASLLLSFPMASFARWDGGSCEGDQCPFKGKGEEQYACPVTEKFMKKAEFFLDNQQAIGLSDDQVSEIKQLKLDVKKAYIRGMAEHEVFSLDIQSQLSQPKVDTDAVNGMIDQFAAGMTKGAKDTVASYVKMKGILSKDQMAKAKEIWMAKK